MLRFYQLPTSVKDEKDGKCAHVLRAKAALHNQDVQEQLQALVPALANMLPLAVICFASLCITLANM